VSYDDQLQLLLENLNKNEKLNPTAKVPAAGSLKVKKAMSSQPSSHTENSAPRPPQVYHANNQNSNQLMTQAYHLINEVIMHP